MQHLGHFEAHLLRLSTKTDEKVQNSRKKLYQVSLLNLSKNSVSFDRSQTEGDNRLKFSINPVEILNFFD